MFPTYPSFEDVIIRAEIQWQGRARPLAARIARWPLAPQLVFGACYFEDDASDGEWALLDHLGIFVFPVVGSNADNSGISHEKLISIFKGQLGKPRIYLGRLVELALPDNPRFALCAPPQHSGEHRTNFWVKDHIFYESFDFAESPFHLDETGVRAALQSEWRDEQSDARFAWQWAQWSYEEQDRKSLGAVRDVTELSQVARWIMQCSPELWRDESNTQWTWHLSLVLDEMNSLSSDAKGSAKLPNCLGTWLVLLRAHFAPQRRADWFEDHRCVREFWSEIVADEFDPEIIRVEARRPGSHHQLLETKLALRHWLRRAATFHGAESLLRALEIAV